MSSRLTLPSYHQGFARHAGESAHPGLWRGLVGAWVPALGPTGASTIKDVSVYRHDATGVSLTDTSWKISRLTNFGGAASYALDCDGSADHATLPNLGGRIDGNTPRTLIVRFVTDTVTVGTDTLLKLGTASALQILAFHINVLTGGDIYILHSGRDWHTNVSVLTIGNVHHGVYTYNGGAIETAGNAALFLDGTDRPLTSAGASTGNLNTIEGGFTTTLCSTAVPDKFFNGRILYMLLYDRVLLDEEKLLDYLHPLSLFRLRRRVLGKAPAAAVTTSPWYAYAQMQ